MDPLFRSVSRLRQAGAGPGQRVGLLVEPDPAGANLIITAARTEGTFSVLSPKWTGPELGRILDMFVPDLLVVGPGVVLPDGFRGGLPGGTPLLRWSHPARVRTVEPGVWGWGLGPGRAGSGHPEPDWVVWTSGSSGAPRGIVLPQAVFRISTEAVAKRLGLGPDDRWIASLGPAHVGGLALILRSALRDEALVLPGTFDPEGFNHAVDRSEATHASLVPTQLMSVLDARRDRPFPRTFRTLLLGGAPTPPPLLERALAARVPLALTYGATETASQAATAPPDLVRRKPGSVGAPLDGIEIRAGSEDGGADEILVRGPTLARGVFQGPDRDAEPLVDEAGWYRTGDLGVLDEEGHLRVTGRLADRIISGGINVDPAEVESVLLSHPEVRDAAVLGIPDERWGERVIAVVVPRRPGLPPTEEALLEHARRRISSAKRPRRVVIRARLPRTPTGKLDRRALGRSLAGLGSDEVTSLGPGEPPFLGSSES